MGALQNGKKINYPVGQKCNDVSVMKHFHSHKLFTALSSPKVPKSNSTSS